MDKVLLVDDDVHILKSTRAFLDGRGYQVLCARTAAEALALCQSAALDCIVLDVDLPDGSGVELCERLRQVSRVPVLFLSAYSRTDDRIRGLLAGGDDYMGKPFSLTELELRVRVHISRRQGREETGLLRFGELEVDFGLREVRSGGQKANLSALEFDLLAFLVRHPGQVFSYAQLYDRVWNEPMNKGLHNLQMCMARVRMKLEDLCPGQSYIETVRRKGYRFRPEGGNPPENEKDPSGGQAR